MTTGRNFKHFKDCPRCGGDAYSTDLLDGVTDRLVAKVWRCENGVLRGCPWTYLDKPQMELSDSQVNREFNRIVEDYYL